MIPEATDDPESSTRRRRLTKALRHPVRTQMYAELRKKRAVGPSELACTFGKPLPWVTYHYGVLEGLGGAPKLKTVTDSPG